MQLLASVRYLRPLVVSILTGPFGPVQREGLAYLEGVQDVSILTGPFGPVQLPQVSVMTSPTWRFQSSPALSGRCNVAAAGAAPLLGKFQSSPALSGRCNPRGVEDLVGRVLVSILTGPFGPVQLVPEGATYLLRFQSSPALSGRCNQAALGGAGHTLLFQSSPALSGRCNRLFAVSSLRRGCFNPHRPFRAGATAGRQTFRILIVGFQSSPALSGRCNMGTSFTVLSWDKFQSSPALSGRCNGVAAALLDHQGGVSILTGPFGPVQRVLIIMTIPLTQFQSSPALSGRCNSGQSSHPSTQTGFNPHRPFRAGATNPRYKREEGQPCFNPHRPFRAGATRCKYLP